MAVCSEFAGHRDQFNSDKGLLAGELALADGRRLAGRSTYWGEDWSSQRMDNADHLDVFALSPIAILCEDWSGIYASVRSVVDSVGDNFDAFLFSNSAYFLSLRKFHRIIDANASALDLLGISNLTELRSKAEHLLPADPRFNVIRAIARGERFCQGERDFVNGAGRRVQILWRCKLPANPYEFDRVYFFAVDMSEQKRAQEALDMARSNLNHAGRLSFVGELTASLAHEVAQPINSIGNLSEAAQRWLSHDKPNVAEAKTAIQRIAMNAKHAGQVVHRVRNFAKRTKTEANSLDPATIIANAAALVAYELNRQKTWLKTHVAPGIPHIVGDDIQIQQVIVNAMINALQAMSAAETLDRGITISAEASENGFVTIQVTDTGPGVASDSAARAFEPFFSTKPDGVGLGLSICRRIVEDHGGQLWFMEQQVGASLAFTLPIAAEAPAYRKGEHIKLPRLEVQGKQSGLCERRLVGARLDSRDNGHCSRSGREDGGQSG